MIKVSKKKGEGINWYKQLKPKDFCIFYAFLIAKKAII
jgi:hypothetical protein